MAADLSIHALVAPCTESDLARFFKNTMGSKWFDPWSGGTSAYGLDDGSYRVVADTPQVWVGEVSWLKAMLSDPWDDSYVPEAVEGIHDLIGESLPVLDEVMRERILTLLRQPQVRARPYSVAEPEDIAPWLDEHMGCRLFTVSW
jgi:hypothetical protein